MLLRFISWFLFNRQIEKEMLIDRTHPGVLQKRVVRHQIFKSLFNRVIDGILHLNICFFVTVASAGSYFITDS